ncbi:MAG: MBOAT family protein [Lachnospiraceae bacterium]|nr:MBOAT family protein [Lachnospiraceae bacterium]
MLFSSITFLYYFLPVVLFLYYLLPGSLKNLWLLLASLFFYGWGEPVFVLWMILAIVLAYIAGILIETYKKSTKGRWIFILAVAGSVGYLGVFKYADFFMLNLNQLTGMNLPLPGIGLPIGISFYTFQIISYLVDVYRGDAGAKKNIISFALYISMFPQLIAGPIVRYTDIEKQLDHRQIHFYHFGNGISRFVLGLSKKVLLANPLGEFCEIVKGSSDLSVAYLWLYGICYALHIYFDFSGYSDMAIGLGKMLGFHFIENFNYPYISGSISEFWRRWHMSLGSWFRDYVYIPLGGNRVPMGRFCFNIFIVWFLTGFWHGAGWNFILWGLYFGVLLVIEKFWLGGYLKRARIWNHIYVLFFIVISFVIFDGTDSGRLVYYLKAMFGGAGLPVISKELLYYLRHYGLLILTACGASLPYGKKIYMRVKESFRDNKLFEVAESMGILILLLIVTAYLVDGSFNPFLYFRF